MKDLTRLGAIFISVLLGLSRSPKKQGVHGTMTGQKVLYFVLIVIRSHSSFMAIAI